MRKMKPTGRAKRAVRTETYQMITCLFVNLPWGKVREREREREREMSQVMASCTHLGSQLFSEQHEQGKHIAHWREMGSRVKPTHTHTVQSTHTVAWSKPALCPYWKWYELPTVLGPPVCHIWQNKTPNDSVRSPIIIYVHVYSYCLNNKAIYHFQTSWPY